MFSEYPCDHRSGYHDRYAAPTAVAGYALVYGITKEAVPSEIWRQIFCIVGGGCVGLAAWMRLAADVGKPAR